MSKRTSWNGSEAELLVLIDILSRNCTCQNRPAERAGQPGGAWCGAHSMLFDQRAVDGLLFGRRTVERLLVKEFAIDVPATADIPANC